MNFLRISSVIHYQATQEDEGLRLDQALSRLAEIPSRSAVQRWVREGLVKINLNPVNSSSRKIRQGDRIDVSVPAPKPLQILPEPGELEILHEDRDLVVLEKPAGLVIHPSPGHEQGTLVNRLLHHCKDLSGIGGRTRPGIVHRLDKDTSGVLVVAKNDESHQHLSEQFRWHTVQRDYQALVWGKPDRNRGTVDAPLGRNPVRRRQIAIIEGGRKAVTHWEVIRHYSCMSLLACRLETGRTHQIRVHLHSIGLPVVGDPLYGTSRQHRLKSLDDEIRSSLKFFKRQALHAHRLGFVHPRSGIEMEFKSPLPEDYRELINLLKGERYCQTV